MSIIFMEGFDWATNTTGYGIGSKYAGVGVSSISNANSRTGVGNGAFITSGNQISKVIPNNASIVVNFAIQFQSVNLGGTNYFFYTYDGASQQGLLGYSGPYFGIANGGGTFTATGTTQIRNNIWYYIEFKYTVSNSVASNSCVLKVNGATVATVPAGTNMRSTSNNYVNQVKWQANSCNLLLDDIIVMDANGTTNNDFIGDYRVETLFPTGNGTYSAFTNTASNSTNNYTYVDDTNPDSDTTYVESANAGDKDTYTIGSLSSGANTVAGISVNSIVRKTDVGTKQSAATIRTGGSDFDGTTQNLSNSYTWVNDVWDKNPNTTNAWTKTEVNALEIGTKVIS